MPSGILSPSLAALPLVDTETNSLGSHRSDDCLDRRASLASAGSSTSSCSLRPPRTRTTDDSTLVSLEIRTLIGTTFSLIAFTTDSISHLKSQILYEQSCGNGNDFGMNVGNGPAHDSIVLVYKGTTLLDDEARLCDYGIYADTQIDIFPRLRAGPGNLASDMVNAVTPDILSHLLQPGTIVVLCNQENELFVLEVQLRNRHGQAKILRNADGSEKSYIDMTCSAWNAEQISEALLRGGEQLQSLMEEVQRLEGPLMGLEQLNTSDAPSTTICSRPVSSGESYHGSLQGLSSESFTDHLNSIGASPSLLQRLSGTEFSSDSFLATDLDQLGLVQEFREVVVSRPQSGESAGAVRLCNDSELAPLRSGIAKPPARHRQRNRTVADPCNLESHEQSVVNIPLLSKMVLPAILSTNIALRTEKQGTATNLVSPALDTPPPRPLSPPVCKICNKRLRIALSDIRCKCGLRVCTDHKAEKKHNCTWDWKGNGKASLQSSLPACVAEKIRAI